MKEYTNIKADVFYKSLTDFHLKKQNLKRDTLYCESIGLAATNQTARPLVQPTGKNRFNFHDICYLLLYLPTIES